LTYLAEELRETNVVGLQFPGHNVVGVEPASERGGRNERVAMVMRTYEATRRDRLAEARKKPFLLKGCIVNRGRELFATRRYWNKRASEDVNAAHVGAGTKHEEVAEQGDREELDLGAREPRPRLEQPG
jgi:hypothetical protein